MQPGNPDIKTKQTWAKKELWGGVGGWGGMGSQMPRGGHGFTLYIEVRRVSVEIALSSVKKNYSHTMFCSEFLAFFETFLNEHA